MLIYHIIRSIVQHGKKTVDRRTSVAYHNIVRYLKIKLKLSLVFNKIAMEMSCQIKVH